MAHDLLSTAAARLVENGGAAWDPHAPVDSKMIFTASEYWPLYSLTGRGMFLQYVPHQICAARSYDQCSDARMHCDVLQLVSSISS